MWRSPQLRATEFLGWVFFVFWAKGQSAHYTYCTPNVRQMMMMMMIIIIIIIIIITTQPTKTIFANHFHFLPSLLHWSVANSVWRLFFGIADPLYFKWFVFKLNANLWACFWQSTKNDDFGPLLSMTIHSDHPMCFPDRFDDATKVYMCCKQGLRKYQAIGCSDVPMWVKLCCWCSLFRLVVGRMLGFSFCHGTPAEITDIFNLGLVCKLLECSLWDHVIQTCLVRSISPEPALSGQREGWKQVLRLQTACAAVGALTLLMFIVLDAVQMRGKLIAAHVMSSSVTYPLASL